MTELQQIQIQLAEAVDRIQHLEEQMTQGKALAVSGCSTASLAPPTDWPFATDPVPKTIKR